MKKLNKIRQTRGDTIRAFEERACSCSGQCSQSLCGHYCNMQCDSSTSPEVHRNSWSYQEKSWTEWSTAGILQGNFA